MLNRVTFITAAIASALLSAGCAKTYDPAPERNAIRFEAGSMLLNDDATKAGLKNEFTENDNFAVFGNRMISNVQSTVFGGTNGVTVTYGYDGGASPTLVWTYSPERFWYWESTGDYYDFVAMSPSGKGSVKMGIPGNLAVSTHFDISSDNYDLMGAAFRRRGNVSNPSSTVPLNFVHLTSAVRINIINNSETQSVTIDSYCFRNLMVVGDTKVTLDLMGSAAYSWINTERNTSDVRQTTVDESLDAGDSYAGDYDFMVPQRLDQAVGSGGLEANMPKLFLYYTMDSVQHGAEISLKDICPRGDDTPITSWERGVKYTYEISMRLDGGVLVNVVTTDWDTVEAETPGLLIE